MQNEATAVRLKGLEAPQRHGQGPGQVKIPEITKYVRTYVHTCMYTGGVGNRPRRENTGFVHACVCVDASP